MSAREEPAQWTSDTPTDELFAAADSEAARPETLRALHQRAPTGVNAP